MSRKPRVKTKKKRYEKNVYDRLNITNDEYGDEIPEIRLWRAVVIQAICDLKNKPVRREQEIEQMQADQWLMRWNRDFEEVCGMAGLDAGYIRKTLKEALAEGLIRKHELQKPAKRQPKRRRKLSSYAVSHSPALPEQLFLFPALTTAAEEESSCSL